MQNIVDRAKEKWNKKADDFNQWGDLGLDEILQLIIKEEKFTSHNKAIVKCHCCGSENVKIKCGSCHEERVFGTWSESTSQ